MSFNFSGFTTYEDLARFKMSDLRRRIPFDVGSYFKGRVIFERKGQTVGELEIMLDMRPPASHLTFRYRHQQTPIEYTVEIESVTSNLGVGRVWYFRCPVTDKRCRILYLKNGRFLHREAGGRLMYACQTEGKAWRGVAQYFRQCEREDRLDANFKRPRKFSYTR